MKRFASLLFALALSACAGMPESGPPPLESQIAALKTHLYVLIAEERAKLAANAKPLLLDPELSAAAQAHADDMAKNRSFDEMGEAMGSFAINALLADPKFHGLVGENAAAQYFTRETGFDPKAMARGFLDIWLNSPGHKSNLADPIFDRTGIGITANGDAIYAAEIFATDQSQ